MKKLEVVIRQEKVPQMKAILSETGVTGAMFTSVSGYGNQKSQQYVFRGETHYEQIFLKTKVETVVSDEVADVLIQRILKDIPTGEVGDGKIFVYDIADIYRIRTGEQGPNAL